MAPEAKQIYFFFIHLPPEIGTAVCCWISRMCPVTLTWVGWRAVNGCEIHPVAQPLTQPAGSRANSMGEGSGDPWSTQLLSVISCILCHAPPRCSREGVWTPRPFLSSIPIWQTHSRQLEEKKKTKVQPIPNDLVSKISDQFPKTLPWGFF